MATTNFVDFSPATPIVAAWLNDVNDAVYSSAGFRRFLSYNAVTDYGSPVTPASFAQAVGQLQLAGGGLLHMGNYSATQPPANYSGVLLDYDGPNVAVAFGTAPAGTLLVTQKAWLHQDPGNHIGNIHSALHIGSYPVGSGASGPTNTDVCFSFSHVKQNVDTTTVAGEMDSIYFQTVNGGPDSDTTSIVANTTNYGIGFTAFMEVVTSIIAANVVTQQIDVQLGVCDSRLGDHYGLVLSANVGALSVGLLLQSSVTATGHWTDNIIVANDGVQVFRLSDVGHIWMTGVSGGATMTLRNIAGVFSIANNGATTQILQLDQGGNLTIAGNISLGVTPIQIVGTTSATASAGAATLPANPLGFLNVVVGATQARVPYYNV